MFFARYLERYVFFARYLERYVFCLVLCALWLKSCGIHLLPKRGSPLCFFLHSSGREELDSLPIVLELENTLWFSNSCLQLGTNSFAGIVLELCMDRELVAKMGVADSDFLHSSGFWSVGLERKKRKKELLFCQISGKICVFCQISGKICVFCQISGKICVLSSVVRTLAEIVWNPFVAKTR